MAFNDIRFGEVEKALLTTLLYSDIFHFPLTMQELWRFLIIDKKITRKSFLDALKNLSTQVHCEDDYYCLSGEGQSIVKRKENLLEVQKKLRLAKHAAFLLSHIPTVRFIGISGGLSVGNASPNDDIDLFIIVKKGTLFVTRFWILALLEWKGMRRKRNEKNPADKMCVNLLMDETKLAWSKRKQDLYTAHEIVQIYPLFDRGNTYEKFMESNTWVKTYLANSQDEKHIFLGNHWHTSYRILSFLSMLFCNGVIEKIMRSLQIRYMKRHHTTEQIARNVLALHPNDYRIEILRVLRLKCDKLGLLTNF